MQKVIYKPKVEDNYNYVYNPSLNKDGEFIGHGFSGEGRLYEGYYCEKQFKYYFVDNGEEFIN